jgi:outer membrane immunogenic protein
VLQPRIAWTVFAAVRRFLALISCAPPPIAGSGVDRCDAIVAAVRGDPPAHQSMAPPRGGAFEMKNLLLASVAAVALYSTPSLAQSPTAPVFDWSGFYVGANAGYGWGASTWTAAVAGFFALAPGDQFPTLPRGALAGGQVGLNWQSGPLVLGAEFSGAAGSMNDTIVSPFISSDRERTRVSSIRSATAKLGLAVDRHLLYAKGGAARSHIKIVADASPLAVFSGDRTRTGWTIGAGWEYALAPNWILGVEFNHYDFGSAEYRGILPGDDDPEIFSVRSTVQSLVARLSYKFGG